MGPAKRQSLQHKFHNQLTRIELHMKRQIIQCLQTKSRPPMVRTVRPDAPPKFLRRLKYSKLDGQKGVWITQSKPAQACSNLLRCIDLVTETLLDMFLGKIYALQSHAVLFLLEYFFFFSIENLILPLQILQTFFFS